MEHREGAGLKHIICSKSHKNFVAELELEPRSPGPVYFLLLLFFFSLLYTPTSILWCPEKPSTDFFGPTVSFSASRPISRESPGMKLMWW